MSAALLLGLGVAASGCALPRVDFAAAVEDFNVDELQYRKLHDQWTHYFHLHRFWDTVLDGHLTLMTPQFRAAYARKRGAMMSLAPWEREKLLVDQRKLGEEFVDAVLVVQAGRWEWNDFATPRTLWAVTFHDDKGRVAAAVDRQGMDDKPEMVDELFGGVTPFTRSWRIRFPARFPDGTPLLRPDEREVAIRIAGPLGAIDTVYHAR